MSNSTKALVLTYVPDYCSWTNVSAVYIVSIDFDYEVSFSQFKKELSDSGIVAKANHAALISEHGDLIGKFHEWLDARFTKLDFESVDE